MALPAGLQDEQIRKAVAALLKHITKQKARANDLLEEDELLYMVRHPPFCCRTVLYALSSCLWATASRLHAMNADRGPEEDATGSAQGQAAEDTSAALPL